METAKEASMAAANCPAPSQGPVKTWLSSKRGMAAPKTAADVTSRFQGDGVRYKAKLIGVDYIPEAQGDKMCLDSMMKLKGQEVASRNQGQHKQRVWLKVSTTGLKLVDERTGAVQHDHESGNISSLRKDESDPRALSYVYNHEGSYKLYYIKMANLADPVLDDIKEVCQSLDQGTQEDQKEVTHKDQPTENGALLLLDEQAFPLKGFNDLDMFNLMPSSSGQSQETSSRDELMDIFSIRLEDPPGTRQNSELNQTGSPQQSTSLSPILPTLPGQPLGVTPFTIPTSIPWGQQGPLTSFQTGLNAPWGTPTTWPTQPAMTGWAPGGMTSQGCPPLQAYGVHPQPGVMWGQSIVTYPTATTNDIPYGGEGFQQPVSPTTSNKPAQR